MKHIWRLCVNGIIAAELFPRRGRGLALRLLGVSGANQLHMVSDVRISTNKLAVGSRVFINHGVFINNLADVHLGDDVALGPHVLITTVGHDTESSARRQGTNTYNPVTIGQGTWLGARAVILPGVTVGEGCIVAAGAVVNKDCEPNGLYGGVPARRLRDLPTGELRTGEKVAGFSYSTVDM